MRIMFGLVGLLITVAIIMLMMVGGFGPGGTSYLGTVAKTNKDKRAQVQQFSGKTSDGVRANTFLTLTEHKRGYTVTAISGGPFAALYGITAGDVIVQVGPQDVHGFIITDEPSLRDFLDDAFARSMSITVLRKDSDGLEQEIELKPAADNAGRPINGGIPGGLNGLGL